LQSLEKSTVRIGTLMPTPSVSVPQMTLRSPRWARLLHEHAVLGEQARVVDSDALLEPLADVGPVGLVNGSRRSRAPTAFFSSRVQRFRLVKSCALSAASFCVK
jgi:hypothetical protein